MEEDSDLQEFLKKQNAENDVINQRAKWGIVSDDPQFPTYIQQYRKELEQLAKLDAQEKRREIHKYDIDEKLAQEMDTVKRDEIREIKLRQLLWQNSPELRELERKLREAYAAKELAFQITKKKADRLEEKVREQLANETFESLWQSQNEYYNQRELLEKKKKEQYKNELQTQMLYKESLKHKEYEEFLKEKKMLDEIAQRIHDEDTKNTLIKMEQMKKTKEEMAMFEAARKAWKKWELERINEENQRIERYLQEMHEKQVQRQAEERVKKQAKEKLIEKLSNELMKQTSDREERENLMLSLSEIEAKEADEEQKRQEIEKKFRTRLELAATYEHQIHEREEKERKEREYDIQMRQQLMDKLMKEEKLEQLSNEKRRRKMIEIRRTIEQMMREREQKRAEEIQQLWRLKELEKEDEEARKQKIEYERMQLLKEHVKILIGFIPPNVLREDDLNYLEPDVASQLREIVNRQPCD